VTLRAQPCHRSRYIPLTAEASARGTAHVATTEQSAFTTAMQLAGTHVGPLLRVMLRRVMLRRCGAPQRAVKKPHTVGLWRGVRQH
jgi:hypothetical protein